MKKRKDRVYSWPAYVVKVAETTKRTEIAKKAGISPSAASRWLTSKTSPTNAAHVAQFAIKCKRGPVEAFVAANLLDFSDAIGALDQEALDTLAEVEVAKVMSTPTETSRSRTEENPKKPS